MVNSSEHFLHGSSLLLASQLTIVYTRPQPFLPFAGKEIQVILQVYSDSGISIQTDLLTFEYKCRPHYLPRPGQEPDARRLSAEGQD